MLTMPEEQYEQISKPLLNYLRTETKNPELQYTSPPKPLTGGYEAQMYEFTLLNQPKNIPEKLVLRILPADAPRYEAYMTGTIQTYLANQNYPTPKTHFIQPQTETLGGQFIIMEYIQGKTMYESYSNHYSAKLMAEIYHELHSIDPTPLIRQFKEANVSEKWFQGLVWREEYIQTQVKWLRPALKWVKENYPTDRINHRICHGDLHPLNIMVRNEKVVGIVDWGCLKIEDFHYDLAELRSVSLVLAPIFLNDSRWKNLFPEFLEVYRELGSFDESLFDFFVAFVCLHTLANNEKHAMWNADIVEILKNTFQEKTNISL